MLEVVQSYRPKDDSPSATPWAGAGEEGKRAKQNNCGRKDKILSKS